MLPTRLPKLAPATILRPSLQTWFIRHSHVPLRLIAAPAGSGKSTALINHASSLTGSAAYCSLAGSTTRTEVRIKLGAALGLGKTPASYSETLDLIAYKVTSRLELLLDDIDDIPPEALADLMRLALDGPQTLFLTLASRARSSIEIGRLASQGIAALCDARRLAFTESHVEQLCETSNVSYTRRDVIRLLDATDGWAVVVSGAIRNAASEGRSLESAFDFWRRERRREFDQFLKQGLAHCSQEQRGLLNTLLAGAKCEDEAALQDLESAGLFVTGEGSECRPYRALTLLNGVQAACLLEKTNSNEIEPLQVRLFGRFQAEVAGHSVQWIRRRDQEIFKYIASTEGGSVERSDLANVFWPDAESHLAAQSIRTSCSNIRKAISRIVGYDMVHSYFVTGARLSINLKHVVVDVNRFGQHVDQGDWQYANNHLHAANAHYLSAERLYVHRLFVGDGEDAWSHARAFDLEERLVSVLERLREIASRLGDAPSALLYNRRVLKLRPENLRGRAFAASEVSAARASNGFIRLRVVDV